MPRIRTHDRRVALLARLVRLVSCRERECVPTDTPTCYESFPPEQEVMTTRSPQSHAGQRPSQSHTVERIAAISNGASLLTRLSVWQVIAIGVVIIAAGLGLARLLQLVIRPLALLFAAIIIAESLSPIVDRMARWIPRALAVAIPYLVFFASVGVGGWLVFPMLVEEAQNLVDQGPELVNQFRAWLDNADPTGDGRITELVTNGLQRGSGALTNIPFTVVSSVAEVILVLAMSLYWLIAKPSMRSFFISVFPASHQSHVEDVLGRLGSTIGGYVRAQLLAGVVIGLITYVGLLLIGVEYALVLAVVAGIGEVIPIVGPILSAIPAIAVALLDSPTQALIVAGFFVVLQQIESNVLQPNLVRNQADIPPLLVLFAIFVGGTVGGILGALVAIPLSGAIKVLVIHVVAPAIRQWGSKGESMPEPSSGESS